MLTPQTTKAAEHNGSSADVGSKVQTANTLGASMDAAEYKHIAAACAAGLAYLVLTDRSMSPGRRVVAKYYEGIITTEDAQP